MKLHCSRGRILISFLFVSLLLTGFSTTAIGKSAVNEIAIKGYDTVAYFQAGKALKGDQSFAFQWHDLTWHFLNQENLNLFKTNPEKYAPQYDGFCAWAMTEERKAITDPEVWKVVDGKLYLNCSMAAYEKWSRDIPGNIKKADINWLKLSSTN